MAPLDSSSIQPVENNFELLCSLKCNNLIPVSKYRSPRTGLTVVIASVEGPVVKGYFTLGMDHALMLLFKLSMGFHECLRPGGLFLVLGACNLCRSAGAGIAP